MKIKLAILERDRTYLSRIVSTFNAKYADKFEVYSFTDPIIAEQSLESTRIEVFLASDAFDVEVQNLPSRCAFAYLVDSAEIDTVKNQAAICKFQKVDLIYKQILNVYSEKASTITGFKVDDKSRMFLFCSPAGGVGTSTVAAACAEHFALTGAKTLYLNLEKYGASDLFFSGEGQYDMSDVIFAVKGKKANLPLKLESCVRRDSCGVFFYSKAKVALDMMEFKTDDVLYMLSELRRSGEYEYIIVDADFTLKEEELQLYRQANTIVLVSDGSANANEKVARAFDSASKMEQGSDAPLTGRMVLVYNRFSSKSGQELTVLKAVGGTPVYAGAATRQIVDQIANMGFFSQL